MTKSDISLNYIFGMRMCRYTNNKYAYLILNISIEIRQRGKAQIRFSHYKTWPKAPRIKAFSNLENMGTYIVGFYQED